MKRFTFVQPDLRHVRGVAVLFATILSLLTFPPRIHADDLDLKKLFEESIPDSPFIAVVYKYADAMIQRGRDTYGPQHTGIFLSALDRNTLKPLETRPPAPTGVAEASRPGAAGQPLVGGNAQSHQNLLRLLYFLVGLSSEDRYGRAADADLTWLLRDAPPLDSGLPPWGARVSWNVVQDKFTFAASERQHGFSRPWMLSERCFDLDPAASKAFALALLRHYAGDAAGVQRTANRRRRAGFLVRAWADAYARTHDDAFLQAIDAVLTAYETNERAGYDAANSDAESPDVNSFHALSLAIDCDGAARQTPEPLRSRLTSLAARLDATFCELPHNLHAKHGFVTEVDSSTADSQARRTSLWNPVDGNYTTAGVGVMCVSRYTNTGNVAYRELIVAAADAYLDSLPGEGVGAWPLAFGQAIALELAAFRITAERQYHDRAFKLGQIAVEKYFGDSPLPRASLNSEHYEAATGGDTLALALAELHLSTRTITAVRTPANTIDR